MKKIILSFDYELFFGLKSGTVQKTLIEPTCEMLDALDSIHAKATFFVDYLMLKYLRKENAKRTIADLQSIESQLKDIISRGHRIELHIHSHWVDAKYNGDGTWDFSDYAHYSLASFGEKEIIDMFVEGVDCLSNIATQIIPEYKICAFRAGGWSIQPFGLLKKAFEKTGIIVDSSVSYGYKFSCEYSCYDFSKTPFKSIYRFEDDVNIACDNGRFVEVPISNFRIKPYPEKIMLKWFFCLHRDRTVIQTDGTHARGVLSQSINRGIFHRIANALSIEKSMFTLSRISPAVIKNSLRKHPFELVTFIDHPKDFALMNVDVLKAISTEGVFITYKDLLGEYNITKSC